MKLRAKAVGLAIAITTVLTACGGGGGGGSGGSGSSPLATTTPPATIQATILALESSGKLPTLDRSASIAGPDANTNGVRDDIDAYIARQGYTAPQLKSVQQTAKALADILLVDIRNQDALRATDLSLQRSIKCLYLRFPNPGQAHATGKNIEKITINTKVRVEAYIKYQVAMDGKVLASPQGDTCE